MKILESHIVPQITEKIRLQEYASTIFKTISTRSGIKKVLKRQEILIDGEIAKTSDWIREGQKIDLLQPKKNKKKIFQHKLEVVFEDDFLGIINKSAGIPTSGNYFKTVENALPFNLKTSEKIDALPYPLPVHRLDNPTSGLLLVAKTRNVQVKLNQAFEAKEIQKTYTAIIQGKTPKNAIFTHEIEGKEAITEIHSLQYFEIGTETFSLVEAFPKTGRTHQIRIHLSENGFPILGDDLYGKVSERITSKGLFLTSNGLQFQHPISAEELQFQLPLPKKFKKLLFK